MKLNQNKESRGLHRAAAAFAMALLLAVLVALQPPSVRAADPQGPPVPARTAGLPERHVVAAALADWLPQYSVDTNGNPTGFAVDMLEAVAERANLKIAYRIVRNWREAFDLLDKGDVDLIPNVGRSPDREERIAFTRPVETFRMSVFVRRTTHDIERLGDIVGRSVAVVRENVAAELLTGRMNLTLIEYDGFDAALLALLSGQVDALAYPEPVVLRLAQRIGVDDRIRVVEPPLAEIKRSMGVRKSDGELLARLDTAVADLVSTPLYGEIYARWHDRAQPLLARSEVLWAIATTLVVLVGLFLGWHYFRVLRLNRRLVAAGEARESAMRALSESETRYRDLIEGSSLAIQIAARDGRRLFANAAFARMAGYDSPDEVLNSPPQSVVAPHDRERVARYRDRMLDGGPVSASYEFDALRKDGTIFPAEAFTQRIKWHGEDAVQRTFIDLTERKKAEAALRDSETRYRDLIENSSLSINIATRDGRRVFVNRAYSSLLGYDSPEELLARPSGQTVVASYHRERVNAFHRDLFEGKRTHATFEFDGLRKDGTIVPFEVHIQRITWNGEDAVERILIDLTERRKAEAALRESETRFRHIFESGGTGILLRALDGRIIEANQALADILGYEKSELIGKTILDFTAPEDYELVSQRMNALSRGETPEFAVERQMVRRDGSIVWAIVNMTTTRDGSGEPLYVVTTVRDINERKLAEAALAESEMRHREMMEKFPLGIQIFDESGGRLFTNQAFADLVGYRNAAETLLAPRGMFIRPEDRKTLIAQHRAMLHAGDETVSREMMLVRRDGRTIPVQAFGRRILWAGRPAVQRTYVDLTERKRAEAAMRISEERFRTVFEAGGAGMTICDMNARYVQVNKAFCDLVGYRAEELVGRSAMDLSHPDDHDTTIEAMQSLRSGRQTSFIREKRYLRKDGATVWAIVCVVLAHDGVADEPYQIGIIQDITERKRAEEALADSRERLLNAQRIARLGYWDRDLSTDRIHWSDEVYRIFGLEPGAFDGTYEAFLNRLVHPDDRERFAEGGRRALLTGEPYAIDYRIILPDGTTHILHGQGEVTLGVDGEPVRFSGTVQDVTELRRAQNALEASEARFRGVFESGGAAIVLADSEGRIHEFNRAFAEFVGYPEQELVRGNIRALFHPDDAALAEHQRQALFSGRLDRLQVERRFLRKDGQAVWASVSATALRESGGRPPTIIGIIQDITQRKRSEEALAQKNDLLDLTRALTVAANQAPTFAHAVRDCLERVCAFAHWPVGHAFVRSELDPDVLRPMLVWHLDDPVRFEPYRSATERMVLRVGMGVPGLVVANGDVAWRTDIPVDPTRPTIRTDASAAVGLRSGFAAPVMVGDRIVAVLEFYATEVVPRDEGIVEVLRQAGTELGRVYEREQAEKTLLRREEQLRQIIDNVPHWIYVKDRDGRYLLANKALAASYGRDIDDVIGRTQLDLYPDKAHAARVLAHDRSVIVSGQMSVVPEGTFHTVDGGTRRIRITKMPYTTQRGEVAVLGIAEDVTEQIRAEEELRRAHRMDALGKMTGGIAHDFNNLLTIILGNLQLLGRRLKDPPLRDLAETAERAAHRGADVTRRLLAFARSQPLEPSPIDLNALVREMTVLVERSLGSKIEIETRLAAGLWQTRADPSQVENALLNLVLNARDAMPDGGRLVIETANVETDEHIRRIGDLAPGSYVMLAVADTGSGMTPEVIARAFEPFFTTKAVGKGSGLGLSMVYGFVRQSGGDVVIESGRGKGATVRLYLPRVATAALPEKIEEQAIPAGSRETVLLVEDDSDVRAFARAALETLDYHVVEASDGAAALAALDATRPVDLLFTDLSLSRGMDGVALARAARRRLPAIHVVFTSGNPDRPGGATAAIRGAAFLQKPYTQKEMAAMMRSVLGHRRRREA